MVCYITVDLSMCCYLLDRCYSICLS